MKQFIGFFILTSSCLSSLVAFPHQCRFEQGSHSRRDGYGRHKNRFNHDDQRSDRRDRHGRNDRTDDTECTECPESTGGRETRPTRPQFRFRAKPFIQAFDSSAFTPETTRALVPFSTITEATGFDEQSDGIIFNIPQNGTYSITVNFAEIQTDATQPKENIIIEFVVNGVVDPSGSTQIDKDTLILSTGDTPYYKSSPVSATFLKKLSEGDTISIQVQGDGSGTISMSDSSNRRITIHRI